MSEFCPIFFASNGGDFDPETNAPLFREGIKSSCPKPEDCGSCELLTKWITESIIPSGRSVSWECVFCLKTVEKRFLPGFWHTCSCQKCGHESSFIQLVIR